MTRPDSPNVRIPPPLIVLSLLIAGLALDGRLYEPRFNEGWAIVLGVSATVIGLFVGGAALRGFVRAGTNPEPWKASTTLVERGVYRFTRNPMYLSMLLIIFGAALIAGAFWSLFSVVLGWAALNFFVIAPEERYLQRRFGADYDFYCSRVRRWL